MKTNLNRDKTNGVIKSGMTPIILKGGHYYIFKDGDNPPRALVTAPAPGKPEGVAPFEVTYNAAEPCQPINKRFEVKEKTWAPEPWVMLFNHLKTFKCNFLRVWLTGGTPVVVDGVDLKPTDLTPFKSEKVGDYWKWRVYDAVVNGIWEEEYFRKLKKFAEEAEKAGIVLQISLFNYVDLASHNDDENFRGWCRSPWNPTLSIHPANKPNWANNHLVHANDSSKCLDVAHNEVEPAGTEAERQKYFLAPGNNLRLVQQALVKKTVQTLKYQTNIIYEIMNEPRDATHRQICEFSSKVIDWILAAANVDEPGVNKRPLISVNASNLPKPNSSDPKIFDVDWWSDPRNQVANYEEIDAISYHGLTGFNPFRQKVCNAPDQLVPPVNKVCIDVRHTSHFGRHVNKSLIYCTDAVLIKPLEHFYFEKFNNRPQAERSFNVRDGQIFTKFPNNTGTPPVQRAKFDLQNWAYWCFRKALLVQGRVHFQNHSLYQITYRRIIDAYNKAVLDHANGVPASEAEIPSEMLEAEMVG